MRKDIMIVKIPSCYSFEEHFEVNRYFNRKFSKYYDLIIYKSDNVTETKVELITPTLWNYIKYKFRNILN